MPDVESRQGPILYKNNWPPIGDQGDTGSCVGWAVADAMYYCFAKAGRPSLSATRFSSRFIWMAAKEIDYQGDRGQIFGEKVQAKLESALQVARDIGVVPESSLPFDAPHLYGERRDALYREADKFKISSIKQLTRNCDEWKQWIASSSPIVANIVIDYTWKNRVGPDGIIEEYKSDTNYGEHAITIVGYRDIGNNDGKFIIRNSYGTQWGDGGFAHASIYYAEEAVAEIYGLIV